MIIRTNENTIRSTSKQHVIPDCCDDSKPVMQQQGSYRVFTVICATCGKLILSLIT